MKKSLIALLGLALCASMFSCANNNNDDNGNTGDDSPSGEYEGEEEGEKEDEDDEEPNHNPELIDPDDIHKINPNAMTGALNIYEENLTSHTEWANGDKATVYFLGDQANFAEFYDGTLGKTYYRATVEENFSPYFNHQYSSYEGEGATDTTWKAVTRPDTYPYYEYVGDYGHGFLVSHIFQYFDFAQTELEYDETRHCYFYNPYDYALANGCSGEMLGEYFDIDFRLYFENNYLLKIEADLPEGMATETFYDYGTTKVEDWHGLEAERERLALKHEDLNGSIVIDLKNDGPWKNGYFTLEKDLCDQEGTVLEYGDTMYITTEDSGYAQITDFTHLVLFDLSYLTTYLLDEVEYEYVEAGPYDVISYENAFGHEFYYFYMFLLSNTYNLENYYKCCLNLSAFYEWKLDDTTYIMNVVLEEDDLIKNKFDLKALTLEVHEDGQENFYKYDLHVSTIGDQVIWPDVPERK